MINVWLALATASHVHHKRAKRWFEALEDEELIFCRFTQLGLLRLLTTEDVMGNDVLTQQQAWRVYDTFLKDGGATLFHEPHTLEQSFRSLTRHSSASPRSWADSYLVAFAFEIGATLITFDRALCCQRKGLRHPLSF